MKTFLLTLACVIGCAFANTQPTYHHPQAEHRTMQQRNGFG